MHIAGGSGEQEVGASPASSWGSVLGGQPKWVTGTEAVGLVLREGKNVSGNTRERKGW